MQRPEIIAFMLTVYDPSDHPSVRLDKLIRVRQTLISMKILGEVLELVREADESVTSDPRFQLLEAVREHDAAIKRQEKDPAVWSVLSARFESIAPATPQVDFYRLNYAVLELIKTGKREFDERIRKLYRLAGEAALQLPELECAEALGHLHYNVAKWFHADKHRTEALAHWQQSARNRFQFYALLKAANEPRERLLAAAQQLAKLRGDFLDFFPDAALEECGVDADVYAELVADYGDELGAFSVKK